MSYLRRLFSRRSPLSVILSVIISVLLVVGVVEAATTISTNIVTGGTLNVTGLSTFIQASSTRMSVHDTAYFGGTATSTFDSAGNLTVVGTLDVTGLTTLVNASTTRISTTGDLYINGFATTTGSNGNFATEGTLDTTGVATLGTASTTSLVVGGDDTNNTISGLIFGTCNLPATTVNASSTNYADCADATGIRSGDLVFVQATSSLPENFIIQSASSTATDTINIKIYNSGNITGDATGARSINFWAVR